MIVNSITHLVVDQIIKPGNKFRVLWPELSFFEPDLTFEFRSFPAHSFEISLLLINFFGKLFNNPVLLKKLFCNDPHHSIYREQRAAYPGFLQGFLPL